VFAIDIRLKTSIDLYTCFRRRQTNCVLVTYATTKRLAYGCFCMLLPKHSVSSRDQSVVIGVMTDREPTVLSGCLFACENVRDIRAIGAYAYQC
jgi:hypothetical protein